ncbi:MAG: hypothetical protein K2Q22_17495 [Cytophagales bacterium]|nr:hypothetical protein [Cytophagales bacterium]
MENLYNSEYCQLVFDKSSLLMTISWTSKPINDSTFKSHVTIFGEKAKAYSPNFLFVDARLHKYTISLDIQRWHDEVVVPIYIKSGIKKIAFLNPDSIFTEVTTKKVFQLENAMQTLPTAFFKTELAAMEWLNG